MKKVLFFVEPHPIRNIFVEFITPGDMFAKIASHENFDGIEWRIFSNKYILDLMIEHFVNDDHTVDFIYPHELSGTDLEKKEALVDFKNKLIYPSNEDHKKICSFLDEWDGDGILSRNTLVDGVGEISLYYESLLEKIHAEYQFTHIVLWSENGAVKQFCSKFDVQSLHFELGPTRLPFQDTILIDPQGTNGNATICTEKVIKSDNAISTNLWMSDFSNKGYLSVLESYLAPSNTHSVENLHGESLILTDIGYSGNVTAEIKLKANFIDNYVVICLQLADDLNTLNHSKYANPLEFLDDVVPKVISLGYNVIIKRHPGAPGRIFNLVKEVEAIEHAKSLSDKVLVLHPDTTSEDFLAITKNSRVVISINSSVSCESWILGTPGLILGNAAYDINNSIKNLSIDFLQGGNLLDNEEYLIRVRDDIKFSLNHYFMPRNQYLLSEVLAKVVNEYSASSSKSYVQWLKDNVDIFEIMMKEKLLIMNNNISKYEKVDTALLADTAIPNESFYSITIEEFKCTQNEFIISGWAEADGVSVIKVFIEYENEYLFAESFERPDVEQAYQSINSGAGFKISEQIHAEFVYKDNVKLYIYGSDLRCRYINILFD